MPQMLFNPVILNYISSQHKSELTKAEPTFLKWWFGEKLE